MNFRKLIYISAVILAAIACKKDEETTTTPSLNGNLQIMGLPEFISPGALVTLTNKGAEHPDGEKIGYAWKVSPSMTKYDTIDVFHHKFADTLQTYSVYCSAYASGYSSLSTVTYTTAVAPGYNGSIQGIRYNKIAADSLYVNNMQHYYKTIGTQTWTLNNIAVSGGVPFRNSELMAEIFGRYYNFESAKAACNALDTETQNWELPTREDWNTLEAYITGNTNETYGKTITAAMFAPVTFNSGVMYDYWPIVGDITNGSGFSAIPVGYANTTAKSFKGYKEYATFWTSDEATETEAYYTYLICDQPGLFTSKGDKASFGASVRCIRK